MSDASWTADVTHHFLSGDCLSSLHMKEFLLDFCPFEQAKKTANSLSEVRVRDVKYNSRSSFKGGFWED